MDQIIAMFRPITARRFVPDVVAHRRSSRREDRDIGTALALKFELSALEAFPNLIVRDFERAFRRDMRRILEHGDLAISVILKWFRRSGVVSVTIDNHGRKITEFFRPQKGTKITRSRLATTVLQVILISTT